MTLLEEIEYKLNTFESKTGATFQARYSPINETLEVVCDANPDALIVMVASDEQIVAVSRLFCTSDVSGGDRAKLLEDLLKVSPMIPLSSLGLQDDHCVLFGAMPVGTKFENMAHELEVQASNFNDVLVAFADYFNPNTNNSES